MLVRPRSALCMLSPEKDGTTWLSPLFQLSAEPPASWSAGHAQALRCAALPSQAPSPARPSTRTTAHTLTWLRLPQSVGQLGSRYTPPRYDRNEAQRVKGTTTGWSPTACREA